MSSRRQEALDYHAQGRPGKIEVTPTKPFKDQRDLSLAYTPGVAEPCLEIAKRPEDAYVYTTKGNLVAVVTNGTAVLGLGNIGALAGKPVMEGKGILFKAFADIDVFDLEVGSENPEDVIRFCQLLEPTVGGINLEDIRSPDCFYIEQKLRETLGIPVFHDDQHGTAIISGAALLNALVLVKKDITKIKIVFAGAGAAAIATAEHYVRLGVARQNIVMCDHKGVIYKGREGLDEFKQRFAVETKARTLAEALQGSDVFVGLSVAGIVTGDMLTGMARRPVIFALANPTPEIMPDEAKQARPDAIVATGRSDFPNQVNNVLGFPFIFRGALDVRAKKINEEMEMAATRALAALAKEEVPESVTRAYGGDKLTFGPDYLIPKPFDPRVAMLSFSNFGSVKHPAAAKVQQAVALLHERDPELQVDGEMQADTAVIERILTRVYPFAKLRGPANVLIFPDLNAANIAYKLLARLGDAQAIGPILVGMDRPVHVLQRLSEVPDIVNMAVIAAIDALEHRRHARSTE